MFSFRVHNLFKSKAQFECKSIEEKMKSQISSGLMMGVVVIMIALECSIAKSDQGNLGNEAEKHVFLQTDTRFLLGRKMLQGMDKKPAYISGEAKPAHLDNSLPQVQTLQDSQESMTKKKYEKMEFVEAADEVANLMRRDYKGAAKRKPPIHNQEPKN